MSNKIKIAFITHSLMGGGAERVTAHLANAWAEMGRDVTIITLTDITGDAYTLHPAVRRIGLNVATDSRGIIDAVLVNILRVLTLRRTLKQLDANVVIAMMTRASVLAVLAAVGLKCRAIISERCYPPSIATGWLWSNLRRIVYPLADCIVAQTQESSHWLKEHAGCKKIVIIPNPVVLPLSPGADRLLPDAVLNADRKLLLAVGRLGEEKGFELLLDAFSRVASSCPQWDLVVLGEGSERVALERQSNQAGLRGRVYLPGYAGNMPEWYSRADLFVLSSRTEGFPNVLIEAMAYGCAAVSYDCLAGPRDIITDGVDGILVKPAADVGALSAALLVLMTDTDARQQMGKNAVAVQGKFSLPHILQLWENVISTSPA